MIPIPEAPKSIQHPVNFAVVLDLNNIGTAGAVTDQSPARVDLEDFTNVGYHEGLFVIEAKTTNGQGATPTSPGAAAKVKVYWAMTNELVVAADAPTVLSTCEQSFDCTLPDSNSAAAAGQRVYQSGDPFVGRGRYLYVWYDRDAFAADALIDLSVRLLRV